MKQRIRDCPWTQKILSADGVLEKQPARNAVLLKRISRFLQIVEIWRNRTLVRTTETLVRSIVYDNERERTRLKTRAHDGG